MFVGNPNAPGMAEMMGQQPQQQPQQQAQPAIMPGASQGILPGDRPRPFPVNKPYPAGKVPQATPGIPVGQIDPATGLMQGAAFPQDQLPQPGMNIGGAAFSKQPALTATPWNPGNINMWGGPRGNYSNYGELNPGGEAYIGGAMNPYPQEVQEMSMQLQPGIERFMEQFRANRGINGANSVMGSVQREPAMLGGEALQNLAGMFGAKQ